MEFNPKVSIIIPVYNGSNYLCEAIDSALGQTYKNTEIIVVNDGSNDGGKTEEIAKSYGEKIRYFYKENGGVASALNFGISVAEGDYISWLSHDDLYLPNKLEVQINYLQKQPQEVVLYSDYYFVDRDSNIISTVVIPHISSEQFLSQLFIVAPVHGCSTLIPKKCFKEIGLFNPKLKTVQDYEMWFRIAKKYDFVHIPQVLIKSRMHDEQGHKTMSQIQYNEFHNLLDWCLENLTPEDILKYKPDSISSWFFDLAIKYKKAGNNRASLKAYNLGIRYFDKTNLIPKLHDIKLLVQYKLLSVWYVLVYITNIPIKVLKKIKKYMHLAVLQPDNKTNTILMMTSFYSPKIGGVEKHVEKVSKVLASWGYRIKIVTYKHEDNLNDMEFIDGIQVFRMSYGLNGRFAVWKWLWRNKKLITDADIVHCHDYGTFWYWYLPFRFLFPRKSVYLTFHGYEGYPLNPKTVLVRKIISKFINGNISIGDFITKWYGTPADFINYGGVESRIDNESREPKNIDAVFIGRLEKDTGIIDYLETIKLLKEKYDRQVKKVVCGDGSLRPVLEEQVKISGLTVEFKGFVNNPEKWLSRSRVALVSGYLAILEAMLNKSLVCSIYDNPLKEDYLRLMPCAGFMIISGSPEELADSIYNCLRDEEKMIKQINQAYEFAARQTWENVAKTYLALWKLTKF
ncbi:MAG: glycosyltransferase [Clostridia bacterium]|nr:glycosyltransferase [Clostridia bacterium]